MTHPPSYAAHEAFIAPARPTAQLWRLVLGCTVAAVVYLSCTQAFYQTLFTLSVNGSGDFAGALLSGSTPLAMFALLFSFGFLTLGAFAAVRIVHRRPGLGLLGPAWKAVRQFRAVLWALLLLNAALWILPPWDWGAPFVPNLPLGRWLALLPISAAAILVQASAEEIVFRGYLQQQLAARFQTPLIWMALPALLFGFGHYLPAENGENAVLIALWAAVFALLMSDLTARAGTLGPAIAVHFVNNVTAILIVSLPDELSGLALYLSPFSAQDTEAMRAWMPVDFALMIVSWLAARLAIRR